MKISCYNFLVNSIVFTLLSCAQILAETDRSAKMIPDFSLPTATGETLYSQPKKTSPWLVVAFLGTECPLAKHYAVRLQQLQTQYASQGVTVLGLFANSQDSLDDVREFGKTHELSFPLLLDSQQNVLESFDATRTPEVFVLDPQRRIRYQGRIDDQFQVGVIRNAPTQEDLKIALNALLSGEHPEVAKTEAVGCLITRLKRPATQLPVTYSQQISRLFQQHCVSCHREGQAAPFALDNYEEIKGWTAMINEVVQEGRMPPWHADPEIGHFRNANSLSSVEKKMIADWVAAGAPFGTASELPPPLEFASEWLLPQVPDVTFAITDQPIEIPPQGEIKYRYYKVDPGFTEDRWIKGAEVRPGNYAVVHHVLVFARAPGQRGIGGEEGGFLAAYVPGLVPDFLPSGMAKKIPAGSELIFQMHYTPNGSMQSDQSHIGLVFADPETITHEVQTVSAANRNFVIPPHANNHEVIGYSPRSSHDVLLLALMPHMHLRGKSFRYELLTNNQQVQPLLDVPAYDFNWQTSYRLQEPLPLPAGARIRGVAHFDNSSANPYNPNPKSEVKWGDQTWEEMMIGYCEVAIPVKVDQATPQFSSRAEKVIAMLDKNGDQRISRDECPQKWLLIFAAIDKDRDSFVSLEELENASPRN